MRKLVFSNFLFGVLVLTGAPVSFAVAHEEHQMKCDETSMNQCTPTFRR